MNKIFIEIVLLTVLASCAKSGHYADPDKVVVDGVSNAGGPMTIKLTRQLVYGAGDSIYHPVENSLITISNATQSELMEYVGNGEYISKNIFLQSGESLRMSFEYNSQQVVAETTVPAKPNKFQSSSDSISAAMSPGLPPDVINYSWLNPDNKYYLFVIKRIDDNPRLIISDTTRVEPLKIFRSGITRGSAQTFNSRNFYYYGKHLVILYAINDEYVPFYQEANTTSQDIISLKTNVQNALGVFTATNSDTLMVTVY